MYCLTLYFQILYLWPDDGRKRQKHVAVCKLKGCCVRRIANDLCLDGIMFSFKALSQDICFFHLGLLSDTHDIYSLVVTIFILDHSCIPLI
jgi:hypothetical protein